MSTSRGSKTRPNFSHLNIVGIELRQAAQPSSARRQAAIVIVAESRFLHEIEHRLGVVRDPGGREFAVVRREGGSRIVVSRLPNGTGIAVSLSAARVNRLDMCVAGRESGSGDLIEM